MNILNMNDEQLKERGNSYFISKNYKKAAEYYFTGLTKTNDN